MLRGILLAAGSALFLSACATLGPPAPPEPETGNAGEGLAFARVACASCHAVESGQMTSPLPSAPAFESVANMRGMNRRALNAWLHSPHPTMPNLVIYDNRIDDLAAYLRTLKRG